MSSPLRTGVLLAPFVGILLVFFAGWAGLGPSLMAAVDAAHAVAANTLGWVYAGAGILAVVLAVLAYVLLDQIRIGGPEARSRLTSFSAIAVGVAATTSLGLLFWGSAEPVYHAHQPPTSRNIVPMSYDARYFALTATYLHWSVTAHALNALFMVAFGLATQNMDRRPALDEVIAGSPGTNIPPRAASAILDGVPIFFVTLSLAAALATCVLALSSEMIRFSPFAPNAPGLLAMTMVVTCVIVIAAARPIRHFYATLSKVGFALMLLLMAGVVVFGPTGEIIYGGVRALWQAILSLPSLSTFTGSAVGDPWPQLWTQTHWANWMILAPLVGMFLSRAARGFTVGEAIVFFSVIPALFSILWIAVFGGLALSVDSQTGGEIWNAIQRGSADDAAYAALWTLNGGEALVIGFVALLALAFVTFAAGVLHAVMCIAAPGDDIYPEVIAARRTALALWTAGLCIAGWALAVSGKGPFIDGLVRLGGPPALIIVLATCFAVLGFCLRPRRVSGSAARQPVQIEFDLADSIESVHRDQLRHGDDDRPVRRYKKRKSA